MTDRTERELLTSTFAVIIGQQRASDLTGTLSECFGRLTTLVESMSLPEHASAAPESIRALLACVPHICRIRTLERLGEHPLLDTLERAQEYVSALYAGSQYEQLCLLCLDKDLHLLECCRVNQGSLKEVSFYPRRLFQEALTRRARAVLLCHNHPSNWAYFSEFDVSSTRELISLCTQNNIYLLDHLLICGDRISSMRSRTYIPEKEWRPAGSPAIPLSQWRSGSGR